MKLAQIYATADQILQDMGADKKGDFPGLFERIKEASKAIQGMIGAFIPMTDTRTFIADYHIHHDQALGISPLLEATLINVNEVAAPDILLQPIQRQWLNGPYTMLERKPTYTGGFRTWDKYSYGDYNFRKGDKIDITGLWGLYEELAAIALSISQATATELTLVATNGNLLSPGMVLLIDNEQEFVSAGNGSIGSPAPTLATSLTNGALDASGSIQFVDVDNGAEFSTGEVIRIDSEDMKIVRISANELTIERGWNQSLIDSHLDNTPIYVYRTYAVIRGVNGTTAAVHASAAVQQYLVPDDVNWLCRQITVLMIKKAESGFQGRVGSATTGDAMYFSEFPPSQIAAIKENYEL